MSAVPPANVRAVKTRSGKVCEGCGQRVATEIHHRKYRSRGGSHEVANLLHLCGSGNHTGCHGRAHSATPPEGWSLPSGICKPTLEPLLYRGERALLDNAGQVHVGEVVF